MRNCKQYVRARPTPSPYKERILCLVVDRDLLSLLGNDNCVANDITSSMFRSADIVNVHALRLTFSTISLILDKCLKRWLF